MDVNFSRHFVSSLNSGISKETLWGTSEVALKTIQELAVTTVNKERTSLVPKLYQILDLWFVFFFFSFPFINFSPYTGLMVSRPKAIPTS